MTVYAPNGRVVGSPFYEGKLAWFERSVVPRRGARAGHGDTLVVGGGLQRGATDTGRQGPRAAHGGTHVSERERAAVQALGVPWARGNVPARHDESRPVHVVGTTGPGCSTRTSACASTALARSRSPPGSSMPRSTAGGKGPPNPADHAPLTIDLDERASLRTPIGRGRCPGSPGHALRFARARPAPEVPRVAGVAGVRPARVPGGSRCPRPRCARRQRDCQDVRDVEAAVLSLMKRVSAIWRFVRPAATSRPSNTPGGEPERVCRGVAPSAVVRGSRRRLRPCQSIRAGPRDAMPARRGLAPRVTAMSCAAASADGGPRRSPSPRRASASAIARTRADTAGPASPTGGRPRPMRAGCRSVQAGELGFERRRDGQGFLAIAPRGARG